MKTGVAFYYKNIDQYNPAWVNKCIQSIRNQSHKDFDVYVINYGTEQNESFDFKVGRRFHFMHKPLSNHAEAVNEIYSWIFETCDVAVNTNIDDYYSTKRIEYLLKDLHNGADVASSNFHVINTEGKIIHSPIYSGMSVAHELKNGFNPVSNPCHVMKKRVFEALKFNSSLVPAEDMDYWSRALKLGFKIVVNPRYLHYYRFHPGQSSHMALKGKISLWSKVKNVLLKVS